MTPVPTSDPIWMYLEMLWYILIALLPLWISIALLYLIEGTQRDRR